MSRVNRAQVNPNDEDFKDSISRIQEYEKSLEAGTLTNTIDGQIIKLVSYRDDSLAGCTKNGRVFLISKDLLEVEFLETDIVKSILLTSNDLLILFGEKGLSIFLKGKMFFLVVNDSISSAYLSPDHCLLATSLLGGSIKIWKIEDNNLSLKKLLENSEEPSQNTRFTHGNKIMVSWVGKTIKVWDVNGYESYSNLNGHTDSINFCLFSQDDSILISASNDNTLRLWDYINGFLLGTLRGHQDNVRFIENIDNDHVISLGDLTLRVWNIRNKSQISVLSGHTAAPIVFQMNNKYFFSAGLDKEIRVWSRNDYQLLAIYKGHKKGIGSLCLSNNKKFLYSGDYQGEVIKRWEIDDQNLICTLVGHSGSLLAVAITKDNRIIATGGGDKSIIKWNAINGSLISKNENAHKEFIYRLALIKNDTRLISTSDDRSIKIWDFENLTCLRTRNGEHQLYSLAVSFDEKFFVTGDYNYNIKIWNCENEDDDQCMILTGSNDKVLDVAITRSLSTIISVGRDKFIRFWDIKPPKQTGFISMGEYYEITVCINSDDTIFATGSQDMKIRIWDLNSKNIISILEGHKNKIDSIKFTKSSLYLVSASTDTTLIIWNLSDMSQEAVLESHTDRVRALEISEDESLICSVSTDHTAKLWRYFSNNDQRLNFKVLMISGKEFSHFLKRK